MDAREGAVRAADRRHQAGAAVHHPAVRRRPAPQGMVREEPEPRADRRRQAAQREVSFGQRAADRPRPVPEVACPDPLAVLEPRLVGGPPGIEAGALGRHGDQAREPRLALGRRLAAVPAWRRRARQDLAGEEKGRVI